MKKTLKKVYGEPIYLGELDFELYDEFNIDDEDNLINKSINDSVDAIPLNIEKLKKIITDIENNGNTHIAIETDIDHHGYVIQGIKIKLT